MPPAVLIAIFAANAFGEKVPWPNEPAGSRLISDHDFSQKCANGWVCNWPNGGSIVQDPTAPISPGSVQLNDWQHSSPTGNSPVNNLFLQNAREVYTAFWWKPSNPFRGWDNVSNKLTFLFNTNGLYYTQMKSLSGPGGPYQLYIALSGAACNQHLPGWGDACGSWNLPPNVNHTNIRLGEWHLIEFCTRASSTPTSKDGVLRFWLDGQPQGDYRNVNFLGSAFTQVQITHSWDQPEPSCPSCYDYHMFDHARVSVPQDGGCAAAGSGGGTIPPPPPPPPPPPVAANPGAVNDLQVAQTTSNSATLSFTQVGDGSGQPARYIVRHSSGPAHWGEAADVTQGTCALPLQGTATSGTLTCTASALSPGTDYRFQLIAYRGTLNVDAVFGPLSNVASGATAAAGGGSTDVNGDGSTDIADVQLAINQAVGASACGSGDVDGDGACTVTDVQKIVNGALGS